MNNELRTLALDVGRGCLDQWNDLHFEQRRQISLTDYQSEAILVAILTAVESRCDLGIRENAGAYEFGARSAYAIIGQYCALQKRIEAGQ